ncbi:MAG: hypothetical protein ACRD2T_11620, partial [Thermoanaerobaculia bacterium]
MRKSFQLLWALGFLAGSSLAIAGEGKEKCAAACAKEGAKCCAEKGKEVAASLCAERAEKLAREIKSESCAVKSAAILASALPGLTCKDALAKLASEIRAKECSKEGAELILTAAKKLAAAAPKACEKDAGKGSEALASLCAERAEKLAREIKAEKCAVKSSEILASALPGLTCKDALAKLASEIRAKECSK